MKVSIQAFIVIEGQITLALGSLILVVIIARILFLIFKISTSRSSCDSVKRTIKCKTIICIGSGGHTTEMLKLMEGLNLGKFCPRYYLMASNDTTSFTKVEEFEASRLKERCDYEIIQIPRSRSVKQSYFTSIFTTVVSIVYTLPIVFRIKPDLVLCNGPGTCIPICVHSFLLKVLFIKNTRIVFIESFCRTKTLSLTGKILVYLADHFLIQWSSLKTKLQRADYIGQLI